MADVTFDTIRDVVRHMREMHPDYKQPEGLLVSQELYDLMKDSARQFVPNIDDMVICKYEGVVVRVDPDLTGNEYRWDNKKEKERHRKLMRSVLDEIPLMSAEDPWESFAEFTARQRYQRFINPKF